ncbi:hypothetical protein ACVWXB_003305 [Streptomyces sp. TE12347]
MSIRTEVPAYRSVTVPATAVVAGAVVVAA